MTTETNLARKTFENLTPYTGTGVYIAETALVIGDVHLENEVSVWPQAVVRGDVNHIHIGSGTNVQDGSILHVTHDGPHAPGGFPLTIGQKVTIGHRAVIHGCTIGDWCLIGIGAIVMDGAVLEDKIMLAAGALVPPGKHLHANSLYMGSPARRTRSLTKEESAFLDYSADHYIQLKNRYLND